VVAAVVALFVLLAIAGVIVVIFVFGGAAGLLNSGGATATTTVAAPSVAATTPVSAIPITEPPQKPLTSSFTFRNVFAPTIKAPVPATTDTGSGTSTSSGSTNSPDTLYLTDIVTTDSGRKGVFIWNGVTYTEGAGGTIDSSPWKVLEVNTDSVLMLYGDTQVTLTLGQGISK
jgi:hypothetical protein